MLELGTLAPEFSLSNTNNNSGTSRVCRADYDGQALLVAFICNHCPYVVLQVEQFAQKSVEWREKGIATVAICSNDVEHYPQDSPEKMAAFADQYGFEFPYLFDRDQHVAKSYRAACTPDFFLFNRQHELVYRGQFDDSRPGKGVQVTGADLDAAVSALVAGEPISENQVASVGCNIKWKSGNAPDYF